MFKKLNKMKIGARLKKSFRQIILIFGILSALVVVIMLYTINNYGTILDNYAYPQGDIAMAMNESAEVRAASRGIVGYDSDSLIESMKEQHEQAVKSFEEYLEKIRPTMITKEGTACMDAIDKAWAEYKEVDAKVIEVGATTDTAKSLQAQQMMTDEAAPKYQALDDALQKLMALNISLGNAKRAQLRTVMIAALTIIIIVIAVSTIYSNSLSVTYEVGIQRFALFAQMMSNIIKIHLFKNARIGITADTGVAVIIVTICLACLMKAKAEGDRIYDELAYKHFSSKEERKGEQTERYGQMYEKNMQIMEEEENE